MLLLQYLAVKYKSALGRREPSVFYYQHSLIIYLFFATLTTHPANYRRASLAKKISIIYILHPIKQQVVCSGVILIIICVQIIVFFFSLPLLQTSATQGFKI